MPLLTESASDSQVLLGRLLVLEGEDLFRLARAHGVLIPHDEASLPQDWDALTLRAELGHRADGVTVRTVPVRAGADGRFTPTHDVRLCAVPAAELADTPFERSAVHSALRRVLLVARASEPAGTVSRSQILGSAAFSLGRSSFVSARLRSDYAAFAARAKRGGSLAARGDLLVAEQHGAQVTFSASVGLVAVIFGPCTVADDGVDSSARAA